MITEPNNLLTDDHSHLDKLLEEVFEALQKRDLHLALDKLDYFCARLAMHIRAEHLHLFPVLLRAAEASSSLETTVVQLRADHDFFMKELAGCIKAMRETTGGKETKKILEAIDHRLREHNAVEESRVYPLIVSLLPSDEIDELSSKIKKELDNLPPRFA